jgi:hypothetical protein
VTQDDLDALHLATFRARFLNIHVEPLADRIVAFLPEPIDQELCQAIASRFPQECGSKVVILPGKDCRDQSSSDIAFVDCVGAAADACDDYEPLALLFEGFWLVIYPYPQNCCFSILPLNPGLEEVAQPAWALTQVFENVAIHRGPRWLAVTDGLSVDDIKNSNEDDWDGDPPYTGEIEADFRRLALMLSQGPAGLRQLLSDLPALRQPGGERIQFFEKEVPLDWDTIEGESGWADMLTDAARGLREWSLDKGLPNHITVVGYGGTLKYAKGDRSFRILI